MKCLMMAFWLSLVKDKRGLKPIIVKLGVALAISFAGFLYSHFRTRRIASNSSPPSSGDKKIDSDSTTMPTPSSVDGGLISLENLKETPRQKGAVLASSIGFTSNTPYCLDEDQFLLPEFNDLVLEEFEVHSNSTSTSSKKDADRDVTPKTAVEKETEKDIHNLKNMVHLLQERERKLEMQLLEFYGLKEQETAVMELQNRLKITSVEAKLFSLKIQSLQADNQRLEAQVAEHSKVVSELESARTKIKLLKRKIRLDEEHTKEQLSDLRHKVISLQSEEHTVGKDEDIQKRLQRLQELEGESTELKLANSRLQYENAELKRRLSSTQFAPEAEALQEATLQLRKENDDLTKEIEQLQATRCSDVEELVYLKWVNACLRYELRNCKAPPGKPGARDLSKTLSPKSEEKAKQLILEYANSEGGDKSIVDFDSEYWSSSQGSSLTDSNDLDDSPVDVSSATKISTSSRSSLFRKLRKLLQVKHSPRHNHSSADRSSTSNVYSGIRKTTSTSSFEDMRTFSHSTASSHQSTIDEHSNKTTYRSPSFSRPSLDSHSQRTLSLDRIKEVDGLRRNSDVGYPYYYKRAALRESGAVSGLGKDHMVEQDLESEKLELMRFAEALKDSSSPQGSSYSSF